MKKWFPVLLVFLLAFVMISSFSTLGNLSGGGAGSEMTTAEVSDEDPSDEYPDNGIYKVSKDLTFYDHNYSYGGSDVQTYSAIYSQGECFDMSAGGEISDRIYLGYAEYKDQRLIAFSFENLEIGKTYLLHFIRYDDYPIDFNALYYRFGNAGNFYDFSFHPSDDRYTLVITPTSSTFQLGVLFFNEAPSNGTLQTYATAIKENVAFDLYEVQQ